jgi:GNAT superfamily N-acetyltransferase
MVMNPEVSTRPLTPDDWPHLARLFGANGACGGCWCMWWRVPKGGKTWDEAKGDKNRDRFRRLVKAGKVHGVLAFAGEEPVGWCAIGPRGDFPRIQSVKALRGEAAAGTWSVVCFYIPARWRGQGVATRLLDAATELAFALGACQVEGYPVAPKEVGQAIPAVFAWSGVPVLFERAGYEEIERPTATRPIFVKGAATK